MTSVSDRRRAFRALHERGCFVLPNPWDVGSARYLERLGFALKRGQNQLFRYRVLVADRPVTPAEMETLYETWIQESTR